MNVEDVLDSKGRQVAIIGPDASIALAVHKLKTAGIGSLVVSEDGTTVSGIVSEREVVRALAEHGAELLRLRVSDIMRRRVVTCSRSDSIQSVMTEMTVSRSRHVPVVEANRLCGLVSIGDLVKKRLEELELEANVLREYIVAR
ncbi:MAG: CBS domain-containing protein [Actinobacteria bacterium ATB1]|nr:CBS domain-containing protein [Actinobacteria bacterium ATB1]